MKFNYILGFYFEEAGKNLNGDLTAGENVADNGGMWESFYAYSNWRDRGNADKFLPGLSDTFTEEQLFFERKKIISYTIHIFKVNKVYYYL